MQCLICKKEFKHLGSHLWHKHKVLAREYKMEFRLDLNYPLIDEEIKIKKQIEFNEHREKYLKNLEKGKEYRFKKGKVNRDYFSGQSMKRIENQLKKINQRTPCNCPMCNQRSAHLPSHLYNAHGLLVVNKDKYNEKLFR